MPRSLKPSAIPLLCTLCPKNPTFSDVSHLLTHISSKSHLSHRFKIQIRCQGDPEARRQLDIFETWYAENGLGELLSERLSVKNQKKFAGTNNTTSFKKRSLIGSKKTTKFDKAQQIEKSRMEATPDYRPPVPRMHVWSTGSQIPDTVPCESPFQWGQKDAYETPTMRRSIPNFALNESPIVEETENHCKKTSILEHTEDQDVDTSQLKGVLWPGMNLFDAATREQKRLRNQKKDGSVLAQMIMTSGDVESVEWVYNSEGELLKARSVFDLPTDSEIERSDNESLSPKKRRTEYTPLNVVSSNTPHFRPSSGKRSKAKKVLAKRKTIAKYMDEEFEVGSRNIKVQTTRKDTGFVLGDEEDEEFRLTTEDTCKRHRFGIFRDATESPGRTESPLEDHRFDFLGGDASHSTMENHPVVSPTPKYKPGSFRYTGKENMKFEQQSQGTMVNTSGFPPQVFHDHSYNPLFYHSNHTHNFSYGEQGKSQQSSFLGDFRPMMMPPPPHQGQSNTRGLASSFDYGHSMNYRM